MSDEQNKTDGAKDAVDAQTETVNVEIQVPVHFYAWVQKLAEMGGEEESRVCEKLLQVALLDIEKRAHAATQQVPKKSPIITKVGDLDQIRMTPRSKKIIP